MITVLVLDDQVSVLEGIKNGVNFSRVGIDDIYTATGVQEAKEIITNNQIDIVLSDIEMPGENGLALNKWAQENYPDIVRILLTSHASFKYAQESIRLGCFDYIVQPAPYSEIEEALSRAVSKVISDRNTKRIINLDAVSNLAGHLYSSKQANRDKALKDLNEMGYPLRQDSWVQTILVDINGYMSIDNMPADSELIEKITNATNFIFSSQGKKSLVCINRYKEFVIMLFYNGTICPESDKKSYKSFYGLLSDFMKSSPAIYISKYGLYEDIYTIVKEANDLLLNNVAKKAGVFFVDSDDFGENIGSLSENLSKWTRLLNSKQFEPLRESILTYISYQSATEKFNLKSLSDFHQEITKIFFVYLYQQDLDIMKLFTSDYSYQTFMNSFKDISSLKTGVNFMIDALVGASDTEDTKDNVQKAIDFILANLDRDISVREVAAYVHFSPEYFSKLFKKETGENVKNYILRLKMDAAKDLLANPNVPINMVATELGYSNFSHFTQIFKKYVNETPTDYRQNILKNT